MLSFSAIRRHVVVSLVIRDLRKLQILFALTVSTSVLYVIKMTDIEVNGKSIGVASSKYGDNSFGGCVVDSGTNVRRHSPVLCFFIRVRFCVISPNHNIFNDDVTVDDCAFNSLTNPSSLCSSFP